MIDRKKVLAFIPARGGSKRIPKKNIKLLNGIPLIIYTINAAKKSKYIDEIIISSDDDEIINIAKKLNCKFEIRSPSLCTDQTITIDVLKDTISRNNNFDILITLQPTSPFRSNIHIDESINLYIEKNAKAVLSVTKSSHPPQFINKVPDNLCIDNFISKKFRNYRSQQFENYYILNGAIYCHSIIELSSSKSLIFDKNCYAYIMQKNFSLDIDDIEDFKYAEFLIQNNY